jgi:hypothetical protein
MRRPLCLVLFLACLSWPVAARAEAPRFGVMMDVGVPSGAHGSVVYRPARALRVHAGGAHNLVAPGVQGGVTLALGTWVSPVLGIEAGRFWPGDANRAVERVSGQPSSVAMLDRVGYDFASAHLGLELGRRWLTVYLRGGVSYLRATLHGHEAHDDGRGTTTTELDLRAVGASAKLGLIVYFAR